MRIFEILKVLMNMDLCLREEGSNPSTQRQSPQHPVWKLVSYLYISIIRAENWSSFLQSQGLNPHPLSLEKSSLGENAPALTNQATGCHHRAFVHRVSQATSESDVLSLYSADRLQAEISINFHESTTYRFRNLKEPMSIHYPYLYNVVPNLQRSHVDPFNFLLNQFFNGSHRQRVATAVP